MPQSIEFTYDHVEKSLYWNVVKSCSPKSSLSIPVQIALFIVFFVASLVATVFLVQWEFGSRHALAFVLGVGLTWAAFVMYSLAQARHFETLRKASLEKYGPIKVRLDPDGCEFTADGSLTHLNWTAVEAIDGFDNGMGFRTGVMSYPLPYDALPAEWTPEDFRRQVQDWYLQASKP